MDLAGHELMAERRFETQRIPVAPGHPLPGFPDPNGRQCVNTPYGREEVRMPGQLRSRSTLEVVRDVVAIARDIVFLALVIGALILAGRAIHAVQQSPTFQQPPAATLPVDPCGGGVCAGG